MRYLLTVLSLVALFGPASRQAHAEAYWVYLAPATSVSLPSPATLSISPRALARRARAGAERVDEADRPLIKARIAAITRTGAIPRVRSRWLRALSVDATAAQLDEIARLPFVEAVRPVGRGVRPGLRATPPTPLFANESDYGGAWAQLATMGVPAMHECGLRGAGVTIAILDTGFSLAHRALADVSVAAAHDFVNDDDVVHDEPGDPDRQDDHGSLVLALLAGADAGSFVGVAPAARYLLAKVDDLTADTPIEDDWWVAGLEWAERQGADVISSSISFCTSPCESAQMDGQTEATSKAAAVAAGKGLWLFNSAGNTGPGATTIRAPGDAEGVFAVGAVDLTGTIVGDSSRGPTADGRKKPDLVGPGSNVLSIDNASESGYRRYNGTSVATPLVAGVAALLREAYPEKSVAELQALLRDHASQADAPDNTAGWGLPQGELATAARCGAGADAGVLDSGMPAKDAAVVEDATIDGLRGDGSPAKSDGGCRVAKRCTAQEFPPLLFALALLVLRRRRRQSPTRGFHFLNQGTFDVILKGWTKTARRNPPRPGLRLGRVLPRRTQDPRTRANVSTPARPSPRSQPRLCAKTRS